MAIIYKGTRVSPVHVEASGEQHSTVAGMLALPFGLLLQYWGNTA